MRVRSFSSLTDGALVRRLTDVIARDRSNTAEMLQLIEEIDSRKLYAAAGYPSMSLYCVHEFGLSEDSACRRITAARTARDFPALFEAVADGSLHLTAVLQLATYLTHRNADELIRAAAHKSKAEIQQLLAQRFPQSEELPLVEAIPTSPQSSCQPALARVGMTKSEPAPARVESAPRSTVAPIAHQRFALHLTMSASTHDKLEYAKSLLSHKVAPGDIAEVLDRALDALIAKLEKQKFASTTRPQAKPRPSSAARTIPAHVRREVRERDGGPCTFVSKSGRPCGSRELLQFDHIEPVAHGGKSTAANLRLRCRAHNQLEAERAFGADFMEGKRDEARERTAAAWAREAAAAEERAEERDVVPWLRQLGFRADEAKRAAAHCERMPESSLEERVRAALRYLRPGRARVRGPVSGHGAAPA